MLGCVQTDRQASATDAHGVLALSLDRYILHVPLRESRPSA